jgi:hypothetical protein
MIIKRLQWERSRYWPRLVAGAALLAFGVGMFSIGGYAAREGFVGMVLRPAIEKGSRTVTDYLLSVWQPVDNFKLDISHEHYRRIAGNRQVALDSRNLVFKDDKERDASWVPAKLTHAGVTLPVKVRLKGTKPDHWNHPYAWSFKVKVKDGKTLFGMRRFALQKAITRGYLNEWYFHQLLKLNGLIALRYDFVKVTLNGNELPIYAIEENFDKRLIENNRLREGPIFRLPFGESAPFYNKRVSFYDEDGSLADPVARNLMFEVKDKIDRLYSRSIDPSDVFDYSKFARYFALLDILGNDHAFAAGQQRFYYNPITRLVEPVGYDASNIFKLTEKRGLLGEPDFSTMKLRPNLPGSFDWPWDLLNVPDFQKTYIQALDRIISDSVLETYFDDIEEDALTRRRILSKSYPWYDDQVRSVVLGNRKFIRQRLNPKSLVTVHVSPTPSQVGVLEVEVANQYSLPVIVIAAVSGTGKRVELKQPVFLPARSGSVAERKKISIELNAGSKGEETWRLEVGVAGTRRVLQEPIFPWSLNAALAFHSSDLIEAEFLKYDHKKRTLSVLAGDWVLERTLLVPKNYRLQINMGTRLTLKQDVSLIIRGPVTLSGTAEAPIVFNGSGASGGFFVLNADERSVVEHTIFQNLHPPKQFGWALPGAVTFHESDVDFISVKFLSNVAEDALNVVRSHFTMRGTRFKNSTSDAFDCDFCEGLIEGTEFLNSENDGIDISGSRVKIVSVRVDGAGDKALSAGERSIVEMENFTVSNVNIALASKDASEIHAKKVKIENSRIGLAVYQKKSEFGAATLVVSDVEFKEVKQPYFVAPGSQLLIDGRQKTAKENNISGLTFN